MRKMSPEECLVFLLEKPRTAKLATVRPNGRPHVAPIWFALDGDDFIFNTWHKSVKARNLRHNNWVSACVDDETPPFAFVKLDGTAELTSDPQEILHWATLIGGRYMGESEADAFGRRNSVEGELLVRVKIKSISGADDLAGW